MLRRIARDSVIYGAATVAARGAQLFLLPIYTRVFTPNDLGVIDLIAVVAALVNVTVALEISQAVGRYLAEAKSARERAALASTTLWFAAAAYAAFAAVTSLFAQSLGVWLFGVESSALMVAAALAIACSGVYTIVQEVFRWTGRSGSYAVASLLYTTTAIGFGLVLILVFDLGLFGVYCGQIGGALLAGVWAWFKSREFYLLECNPPLLRKMLLYSLPLVPSSVAMFVSLNADKMAIQHFLSLSDLGVYGVAYRLAAVAQLLAIAVQLAVSPAVLQAHANDATRHSLVRAFRYFAVAAFALVILLTLFADELVRLFATASFYGAAPLVPLLAIAFIALNLYGFAPGLFIAKRTGSVAAIMLAGAALNLGLNILLTPWIGLFGAATATSTTAITIFAALMVFSQRIYFVPHHWTRLAAGAALAASAVLLRAQLPGATAEWEPALIAGKLAAFVVLAAILAVVVLGKEEIARTQAWLITSRFHSNRG